MTHSPLFSCFLNPGTKFIWAFIVPVVVIILINIGFFIMAATIMWRHQKKQNDKTHIQNIRWYNSKDTLGIAKYLFMQSGIGLNLLCLLW